MDSEILRTETDSTVLTIGIHHIDLLPHVQQVIRDFSFVVPSAARWVAANASAFANDVPGRRIRSLGTRLTFKERLDLGLPKYGEHLNRETLNILTTRGRIDPIAGFDATVTRAIKAARNEAQRLRSLYSRDVLPWSIVFIHPKFPACEAARKLARQLLKEPPQLPLDSCRQECFCGYRDIGRVEAKRLNLPAR